VFSVINDNRYSVVGKVASVSSLTYRYALRYNVYNVHVSQHARHVL